MINFDAPPIKNVIEILLRDMNSGRNIFFNGRELLKKNLPLIKPRALKSDAEKFLRTRKIAEVFTPTKIVKQMVDALDDKKIDSRWLEITCGEAPFITNRYDAETGEKISFDKRTGILDRKLRAAKNFPEAKRAVQSVYGYELQGDSLLIARANVLLSFSDAVKNFSENDLAEVAEIISWNFFQYDGLKEPDSLFGEEIIDWTSGRKFVFGGNTMKKFDFVIGNPPYQEETSGDNKTFAPPVYHKFMEAAQKVGEKVELITPARFLFDAGKTPKEFNKKMLNDEHLKVLDYSQDAGKYFKSVDIEGGIAITLRDETKNFGAIGTFIPFDELKSIHKKVCIDNENFRPLNEIIYPRAIYRFAKDNFSIGTNAFDKMAENFLDEKPNDSNEYIRVYGRQNNKRVFKWIRRDYVTYHETLEKFKIFVPKSFGRSNLGNEAGQIISPPAIGEPSSICTDTFIVVGNFETRTEADACEKYIKSKFARAMLGILKITQDNSSDKWAKVPLQDFTSASDIDWSVSIPEIDAQLYKKYGLDAAEINFIEEKVRPME